MKSLTQFLGISLAFISLLSGSFVISQSSQTFSSLTKLLASSSSHNGLEANCDVTPEIGAQPGGEVAWYVDADGGSETYEYIWTGTENLTGSEAIVETVYEYEGPKTATVTVISGNESKTVVCPRIDVNYPPLRGACGSEVYASKDLMEIEWDASLEGGSEEYSYVWTGSDGLVGSEESITHEYKTGGLKEATLTVISGSKSLTLTCSVTLPEVKKLKDYSIVYGCKADADEFQTREDIEWYIPGYDDDDEHHVYRISWTGTEEVEESDPEFITDYERSGLKEVELYAKENLSNVRTTCQANIVDRRMLNLESRIENRRDWHDDVDRRSRRSDGEGCFIATAAYGTYFEPEVETLRTFRDETLLSTKAGSMLVDLYYKTSPHIADVIRDKPLLKAGVRNILNPVVRTVELTQQ